MLKRWWVLLSLLLLTASAAFAQVPDPRDSIILESKTVAPGLVGNPVAFTMKVYLTNKDTVAILYLALRESTITGNAYADLDSIGPEGNGNDGWIMYDCVTPLTNTLFGGNVEDFLQYDGTSPDRFLISADFSPSGANPTRGSEPPNPTRSAIWELRFMSSDNALGEIRFDTVRFYPPYFIGTGFTIIRQRGQVVLDIPVNFLPGVISVQLAPKGDLNWDFALRPADLVLLLNCVMLGAIPPVGQSYCDLNCDGEATTADVVSMILAVYRQVAFPC